MFLDVPSGKLTYIDPENHNFLEETHLPTPMTTRVYVNLLEGNKYSEIKDIKAIKNWSILCVLGKILFNFGDS